MLTDRSRKLWLHIIGAAFFQNMKIALGASVREEWSLKQSSE